MALKADELAHIQNDQDLVQVPLGLVEGNSAEQALHEQSVRSVELLRALRADFLLGGGAVGVVALWVPKHLVKPDQQLEG